jgi:hypothetical protein
MHQRAVDPGAQFVIRTAAAQHFDLDAMPGIGRDFGAAEPLTHRRRYIIAGNLVCAQMTLDLAETDFVVGIRCCLEAHDMFVIVARFVTELLAHVDHRAHMNLGGADRQRAYDLRGVGAALEVHRIGATERARVIDQRVFRHAEVVIGIIESPGDKIIPAGRLLVYRASFEVFAEETASGARRAAG